MSKTFKEKMGERGRPLTERRRPGFQESLSFDQLKLPLDMFQMDSPGKTKTPKLRLKSPWNFDVSSFYSSSGESDADNPQEGDRRYYLDEDEWAFEEYTVGDWTRVNSIVAGGRDSNGVFLPFLGCRGIYNPLGDPPSSNPIPGNGYRVFTFETDYADQFGVTADSQTAVARSTVWKKFGSYSNFATSGNLSINQFTNAVVVGQNIGYSAWIYQPIIDWPTNIGIANYQISPTNRLTVYIRSRTSDGNVLIETYIEDRYSSGSPTSQDVTAQIVMTLSEYIGSEHYIYGGIDYDNGVAYIGIDNQYSETAYVPLGLSPGTTTDASFIYYGANNYLSGKETLYQDDICFALDDTINKDVSLQHYYSNQPWNTDYSAKDIVLKPAPGGVVRVLGSVESTGQPMPYSYNLTSANATHTLPAINGFPQEENVFWTNGGTYALSFAVTNSETIDGDAASVWKGEGKGNISLVSDGSNWQVKEYTDLVNIADSGNETERYYVKHKNGIATISGKTAQGAVDMTTLAIGLYISDTILIYFGKTFPGDYLNALVTPSALGVLMVRTSGTAHPDSIAVVYGRGSSNATVATGCEWKAEVPWKA